MTAESTNVNLEARRAAFELAFENSRSPLPYEKWTDEELLPEIRGRAPTAAPKECLGALAMVRRLCDDVYEICDAFRDGKLGMGDSGRVVALNELADRSPGFTEADYAAAFSAGLLWTAF